MPLPTDRHARRRPARPALANAAATLAAQSTLPAIGAALLLAGCGSADLSLLGLDPARPQVLVMAGTVNVRPGTLRLPRGDGPVTLTWRLPSQGGHQFADDGVRVDDPPSPIGGSVQRVAPKHPAASVFSCQRTPGLPTEFSCVNRRPGPGDYRVSLRVLTDDGQALPVAQQPLVND